MKYIILCVWEYYLHYSHPIRTRDSTTLYPILNQNFLLKISQRIELHFPIDPGILPKYLTCLLRPQGNFPVDRCPKFPNRFLYLLPGCENKKLCRMIFLFFFGGSFNYYTNTDNQEISLWKSSIIQKFIDCPPIRYPPPFPNFTPIYKAKNTL